MYDLSKEVEVYKASLPYMMAAKDQANAKQMNDHGPLHAQRVHSNAKVLSLIFELTPFENSLLLASALLHDIGMVKNRETHHIVSYDIVKRLSNRGELPFDIVESEIVATLCRWHRKEYERDYVEPQTGVRVGLLATLLRVSDGMDLDYRRSADYANRNQIVEEFFSEQEKHHLSVLNVVALRVVVSSLGNRFDIFLDQFSHANEQVNRLVEELLDAQIPWPIQIVPTHEKLPQIEVVGVSNKKAIVFAYCNAHGLISAAITKKQFEASGFETEVVCNFERTVSPGRFWRDHMPHYDFSAFSLVSIIDLHITDEYLERFLPIVEQNRHCDWRYSSPLAVSGLNIRKMIDAGMAVSFCDERGLFAGSALDRESLFWLKVAGLCNFDDHIMFTMAEKAEYQISKGLRAEIARGIEGKCGVDYFAALIDRVNNNEKAGFIESSMELDANIAMAHIVYEQFGRVLVFEETDILGRSIYDYIYRAMDAAGILPYEGEFSAPFAVYPMKGWYGVRILFMSRFNDLNKAYPVKYFTSAVESQVGSTSTIWQTFADEASALMAINETIARINEHYGEDCCKTLEGLRFKDK